jgi:hypothetical protein
VAPRYSRGSSESYFFFFLAVFFAFAFFAFFAMLPSMSFSNELTARLGISVRGTSVHHIC